MDFMLLYVETFCFGKVTEASLSGLELPGNEELELAPVVLRTLSCLKHLSFPICNDVEFNQVNRDFWTTDGGSGSLVPVCAPRSFANKAAGSGESVLSMVIRLLITPLAAFVSFSHLK